MTINNPVTLAIADGGVTESMIALADGKVLIGSASNLAAAQTLSGDVTVTRAGVTSIGAKKVQDTMIALASGKVLIGDAGGAAAAQSVSGDVTISAAGVTTIGASKVTNAMLAGSIDLTSKVTGVLPFANGGAATAPVYITGSNYTNSTNSLTNVTGLGWSVGSNEVWLIELTLKVGCDNTGGSKLAFTFPAGGTCLINAFGINTGSTTFRQEYMTTSGTATGAFCAVASFGNIRLSGVYVNGSTAGTLQLQAQSTTNTQTTTIYINSAMWGVRIA